MLLLQSVEIPLPVGCLGGDAHIPEGARVALWGKSGVGKSTFLEALAGFIPFTKGRFFWNEKDLTQAVPQKRPLSLLFQEGNLFDHLSIGRNLTLGGKPDVPLRELLDLFDLPYALDRPVSALSGGERQRLALLRILFIERRPLVLLDEPFNGLDGPLKERVQSFFKQEQSRRPLTLLFSTHSQEEVDAFATHIISFEEDRFSQGIERP